MLVVLLVLVFLTGALVGGLVHFCAARLAYEKSLLWPGPRCPQCLQPVRWQEVIPLLGYWLRRRRCHACGAAVPFSTFAVELFTACAFVGLFYLDLLANALELPLVQRRQQAIAAGHIELRLWVVFGWHAVLLSFLILTSVCDLEHLEIPLSITVTGTLIGLAGATCLAWPYPELQAPPVPRQPVIFARGWQAPLISGLYPWPVWHPLPEWLPPGSWRLGLATGLAGALLGTLILRGVRFLFGIGRGIEGLGLGDADLMMMAGSFVGWQVVLLGFFAGVLPALFFGIIQLVRRGDQPMPFGPSLAGGVLIALFCWPALGRHFQPLLFDAWILGLLGVLGAGFLLAASFFLRLVRGTG